MALNFTDVSVKAAIESGAAVVVDFWATWCGPCKRIAPVIDNFATEYDGRVVIGKYNIDDESDFATECGIRSIPTLLFFKNGEQIKELRLVGAQPEDAIRANIESLIAR